MAMTNAERQRQYRQRKKAAADADARRESTRLRVAKHRAKKRAEQHPKPPESPPVGDPVDALAAWSSDRLVVPPIHPRQGQPMALPDYGVSYLRDAMTHRESLLCIGRKNSKSGIVAVFVLGLMAGPLAQPGLRIGTVSVSREKAGELLRQCREIAEASGLDGVEFLKSPAPGWMRAGNGSTAEFLSADKSSGHASGFDYAIADELGLMAEKDRALIAGMRSSTSARNGRFLALSIRGDCPMLEEMIARRDLPTTSVHLYAPEDAGGDVDIADPKVWAAANPGLSVGIKSAEWMRDEAERVAHAPLDLADFKAFDLNLPQAPGTQRIFEPADYRACIRDPQPPRKGIAVVGFDFGESVSATAAVAIWPATGRVEMWMAFGDNPTLVERSRRDGCRYDVMAERGELITFPGRATPVAGFLDHVAGELRGQRIHRIAADDYKDAQAKDAMDVARLRWPHEFRRVGKGKQGANDVRALQRLVLTERLAFAESLAFATAVSNSKVGRDSNGNPGLEKAHQNGRIDLLSAACIAAGLAEPLMDRPPRRGIAVGAVQGGS